MMHSEGANEGGPDDGRGELAPRIAAPVEEPRDKINEKLRDHEADQGGEGAVVKLHGFRNELDPEGDAEEKVGSFEGEFPPRVAIVFKLLENSFILFDEILAVLLFPL